MDLFPQAMIAMQISIIGLTPVIVAKAGECSALLFRRNEKIAKHIILFVCSVRFFCQYKLQGLARGGRGSHEVEGPQVHLPGPVRLIEVRGPMLGEGNVPCRVQKESS